jgi:hypothetical protein
MAEPTRLARRQRGVIKSGMARRAIGAGAFVAPSAPEGAAERSHAMQSLGLSADAGRACCGYGCHCVAYGAIKAPLLVAFATSLVSTFNTPPTA